MNESVNSEVFMVICIVFFLEKTRGGGVEMARRKIRKITHILYCFLPFKLCTFRQAHF